MNEEEKKAIEHAKAILKEWQKIVDIEDDLERDIEMNCYSEEMPFNTMTTLLNLIDKQQKEIQELKGINAIQKYRIEVIDPREFISKDKIKEKIEELKQYKEEIKEEKDTEYYTTLRIIKALRKLLVSGQESDQEGGQEDE